MKSNNNLPVNSLEDDIDKLSKKLYLESPDLWIDFSGKINDNNFDEMVLFFASKYNFMSIVKHTIDNNLIDLYSPSKNISYPNIIQHLMSVAIQNNNSDISNYFKNLLVKKNPSNENKTNIENSDTKSLTESKDYTSSANNSKNYIPQFKCSNCGANIFETGFSVCETVLYKYCEKENAPIEASREVPNYIICCSCNTMIKEVSLEKLNNLCVLKDCKKCGTDLTVCGIIDKAKMVFDEELNKFTPASTSYHCSNCDNLINESQQEYFGL